MLVDGGVVPSLKNLTRQRLVVGVRRSKGVIDVNPDLYERPRAPRFLAMSNRFLGYEMRDRCGSSFAAAPDRTSLPSKNRIEALDES
jgi:hypothetical protein